MRDCVFISGEVAESTNYQSFARFEEKQFASTSLFANELTNNDIIFCDKKRSRQKKI